MLGAGSRRRVRCGEWRRLSLSFGSQTPALVRIEAVVADQMFPGIRHVLGDLRQKIQRIEHLEVALGTGQQVITGGFREASEPVVPRLVDDFALPGDFDLSRRSLGEGGSFAPG